MKIFVKAKTSAKKVYVRKIDALHFAVAVKDPPEKGKANKAIIKALAGYFNILQSQLTIVSGVTAKTKIFEILD